MALEFFRVDVWSRYFFVVLLEAPGIFLGFDPPPTPPCDHPRHLKSVVPTPRGLRRPGKHEAIQEGPPFSRFSVRHNEDLCQGGQMKIISVYHLHEKNSYSGGNTDGKAHFNRKFLG